MDPANAGDTVWRTFDHRPRFGNNYAGLRGIFTATLTRSLPRGWLIPKPLAENGRLAAVVDRLRWHGIAVKTLAAAAQVPVERFLIGRVARAERAFQGHRERAPGGLAP